MAKLTEKYLKDLINEVIEEQGKFFNSKSPFQINPGSGKIKKGFEINAVENMKQLVQDLKKVGISNIRIYNKKKVDNTGRWLFQLKSNNKTIEITMPGWNLEHTRFMGLPGQNIWNFPRMYVDGSSWVWKYAIGVIKDAINEKTPIKEQTQSSVKDVDGVIKQIRKIVANKQHQHVKLPDNKQFDMDVGTANMIIQVLDSNAVSNETKEKIKSKMVSSAGLNQTVSVLWKHAKF